MESCIKPRASGLYSSSSPHHLFLQKLMRKCSYGLRCLVFPPKTPSRVFRTPSARSVAPNFSDWWNLVSVESTLHFFHRTILCFENETSQDYVLQCFASPKCSPSRLWLESLPCCLKSTWICDMTARSARSAHHVTRKFLHSISHVLVREVLLQQLHCFKNRKNRSYPRMRDFRFWLMVRIYVYKQPLDPLPSVLLHLLDFSRSPKGNFRKLMRPVFCPVSTFNIKRSRQDRHAASLHPSLSPGLHETALC